MLLKVKKRKKIKEGKRNIKRTQRGKKQFSFNWPLVGAIIVFLKTNSFHYQTKTQQQEQKKKRETMYKKGKAAHFHLLLFFNLIAFKV